jgi:hypothetical protein
MNVASVGAFDSSTGSAAMTDPRPEPRYGQYSDAPVTPPPPPAEFAPPIAPERKRRSWDVALTASLLFLAVYDVVAGFAGFAQLGSVLSDAFDQQGLGEFTSFDLATSMGLVINIIRIAILAVVIIVSLTLLSRNRLAFWVPLVGGVLAALAVLVCILVVIVADPAFLEYVNDQQL